MDCVKCKVVLSTEELAKKIKCDQCNARLCQACSGLRETEIRVMQLNKRLLKLNCDVCELNVHNKLKKLEENVIKRLANMQDNFMILLNSLKKDLNEGLTQTKAEVVILRESNIELVNLLTNKDNRQVPLACSHIMDLSPPVSKKISAAKPSHTNGTTSRTLNPRRNIQPPYLTSSKTSYAETASKHIHNDNSTLNLSSQLPNSQVTNSSNGSDSHITDNELNSLPNVVNQNFNDNTTQQISANTEKEYQTVTRRRRRINVGSGNGDGKFIGKNENNRKIWLFITRVPDVVGENDIRNYIKTQIKTVNSSEETPIDHDVEVKMLNTNNTRPNNQSFMIGVEPEFQEEVYKPSFWPRKIGYERFDFRRGQHFLRNMQESSEPEQPSSFLGIAKQPRQEA